MPSGKRSFDLALWQEEVAALHMPYYNSCMSYPWTEISEFEEKIGRWATLFKWSKQDCDLRSENSV
jgi:hypothetical protein